MKAIVLKTSTYRRVNTRLRRYGFSKNFHFFICRVSHDSADTYLYFASFSDLTMVSAYLSACNAVYRVAEI